MGGALAWLYFDGFPLSYIRSGGLVLSGSYMWAWRDGAVAFFFFALSPSVTSNGFGCFG